LNTFDILGFIVAVVVTVVGSRIAFKKQKRRSKDGYLVKQLEDGGIDTQVEQTLEFWFYSNVRSAIERVEIELNQRNFNVIVNETEEDPAYVICAFKRLKPDIEQLQILRNEFEQFARQHGAHYDGWGYSSDSEPGGK